MERQDSRAYSPLQSYRNDDGGVHTRTTKTAERQRSPARRTLHYHKLECLRYLRVCQRSFSTGIGQQCGYRRSNRGYRQANSTFHPISNHWCSYVE